MLKSKNNVKDIPLVGRDNDLISKPNATEKATVLNDFFCSVFTKEDISNVPVPDLCNEIRSTDRLRGHNN